jgi:hypothetical protein
MDILKAFGDFNIDNYIGDPSDEYEDSYKKLEDLREYYFERLANRDIYEYIRLVKYIDKSLFDVLSDLAPARAKISKGLLIEPHYLERSKTRWKKMESLKNDYDTTIYTKDDTKIDLEYLVKNSVLDLKDLTALNVDLPNYDTIVEANDNIILEGTNPTYDTSIIYNLSENGKLKVRVRSSCEEISCQINEHTVTLSEKIAFISPGQAAVFYNETQMLGGGYIEKVVG